MTSKPSALSSAAVTEESTPPDMATTTRVSRGEPSTSRLLSIAVVSGSNLCAAPRRCRADGLRAALYYRHSRPRPHGCAGQPRDGMKRRPLLPAHRLRRPDDAGVFQSSHWIKRYFGKTRGLTSSRAALAHGSALWAQLSSAQAWLRRNNRYPVGPALTPGAPPGSTCGGKELATFGTPPGRSEAAMRPASTRT